MNCIFQDVEEHPNEISCDLEKIIADLNLLSTKKKHRIHIVLMDPKKTKFDERRPKSANKGLSSKPVKQPQPRVKKTKSKASEGR